MQEVGNLTLSSSRILEIESLTQDLLMEAYGSEEIMPPIDLNKVFAMSGLTVKFGHFPDTNIAGMYKRDEKTVYLEENDPYSRQIFTAAHELGHYYLHSDKEEETFYRKDYFTLSDNDRLGEQEANWFAASILMPASLVKAFWLVCKEPADIADRFDVSAQAAYYRLKNLRLI